MPRRLRRFVLSLVSVVLVFIWMDGGLVGQVRPQETEWSTYGGDLASRRYRPFDQINRDNFEDPEIAWRFKTDALGPRPEFNLQATPLMVNGVLYTTAGSRRAVVALDAGAGSVWDIAFSRDPQQRYLYVADGVNERVYVLRRDTLELLTSFGDGGRQPSQFYGMHSLATDSRGQSVHDGNLRGQARPAICVSRHRQSHRPAGCGLATQRTVTGENPRIRTQVRVSRRRCTCPGCIEPVS